MRTSPAVTKRAAYVVGMIVLSTLVINRLGTLGLASPADPAQVAKPSNTLVAGRVIDSTTRAGVSDCLLTAISLDGNGRPLPSESRLNRRLMTSAGGEFAFVDLPPGRYVIAAEHSRYARVNELGDEARVPVVLNTGAVVTSLTIELSRRAAVEGKVTDLSGEPMAEVEVRALKRNVASGQDHFEFVMKAKADDRGIYRLAKLELGEYLLVVAASQISLPASVVGLAMTGDRGAIRAVADAIAVEGQPAGFSPTGWQTQDGQLFRSRTGSPSAKMGSSLRSTLVFTTTFFAQSPNSFGATLIKLRAGDEVKGIDFRVGPSVGAVVSGRIRTGNPSPITGLVKLIRNSKSEPIDVESDAAVTVLDADGRFSMAGVAPGEYQLTAFFQTGQAESGWLIEPLDVPSSGLTELDLAAHPGRKLGGHVLFDGRPAAQPSNIQLWLERLDGLMAANGQNGWGKVRVKEDGSFITGGVPDGRYAVRISTVGGWSIESVSGATGAVEAGIDLSPSDTGGITVRLTNNPSSVSGQVTGSAGEIKRGYFVLLLNADRFGAGTRDSFAADARVARTDERGRYRIDELRTGAYQAFAFEQLPRLRGQLLENLRALQAATVKVGPGEMKVLDLRPSVLSIEKR